MRLMRGTYNLIRARMRERMTPVAKALWYIESHFATAITLDDVASVSGVSRYHISRVFAVATGHPVMRYIRGRRLTEAARKLATGRDGAEDILAVALEYGYGSHEAFTRAFREQFGVTPETVRAARALTELTLVEPLRMDEIQHVELEPPRFEHSPALLVAGLCERYTCENLAGIASQWQRFLPYFGHVPGQVGRIAYGVISNTDEAGNIDYLAGVEVADFSRLGPELARLRIPGQRYAVFRHREHISSIRATMFTIFNRWLPQSGHEVLDAPELERYGEEFDSRTGLGGLEIWIPIRS
jgi:AraC family transcriptional regulator